MNKQILGDIKVKTVIYVKKKTTTTTTDGQISDVPGCEKSFRTLRGLPSWWGTVPRKRTFTWRRP